VISMEMLFGAIGGSRCQVRHQLGPSFSLIACGEGRSLRTMRIEQLATRS
jgi:hypothetical protein